MSTKGSTKSTKSTNLSNGLILGFRSGAGVKNTLGNNKPTSPGSSTTSSTKPTSCHCAKCGGVKGGGVTQHVNKQTVSSPTVSTVSTDVSTNSKKEEVKNMESIFRTNNAPVTRTDKPALPYPTKLHLAARICKAVESQVGRPTDATIQQMAALSDETLINLANANNVQFILNHDGSIHRRPDTWGIVKKDDFYDKYW